MNHFEYIIAMEKLANITTIKGIREFIDLYYITLQTEFSWKRQELPLSDIIRLWATISATIHAHTGKNPLPRRYYKLAGKTYEQITYDLATIEVPDTVLNIFRNPYVPSSL